MIDTEPLSIPRIPVEIRFERPYAYCPHADRFFDVGWHPDHSHPDDVFRHDCSVDDCPLAESGYRVEPVDEVPLPAKRRKPHYDRAGRCLSSVLKHERLALAREGRSS